MLRWNPILVSLLLFTGSACAQDSSVKVPVEINHTGKDPVGVRYAYELKDALRGSNGFRLVDNKDAGARIVINLVSIANDDSEVSSSLALTTTVDAEAIPVNGLYVTTVVVLVGSDRVKDMAARIPPRIDSSVTYLRTKWPSVYKMLTQPK